MHVLEVKVNLSTEMAQNTSVEEFDTIISASHAQLIQLINFVVLCSIIGFFGVIGNVINMSVFYKQGLDTTINISFFSMALSDLCCLVMQHWFSICMNPLFENADLPFIPSEVQILLGSIPRESFARITCLITVYITAERCLCIMFPLHIKQMITPRRTAIIIIMIYFLVFLSIFPMYCTTYIGWKFYQPKNRTLLGLKVLPYSAIVEMVVLFSHAILATLNFFAVVIFTAILIRKLRQKTIWRRAGSVDQDKSDAMSNRDKKTSVTVSLIAIILIVCYTPSVLLGITSFLDPEFNIYSKRANLVLATWSFAFVFETFNSSVNVLLYFTMSSKYRQTFLELFSPCNNCVRQSPA